MNPDEMLRCQGMERSFKQVVTDRALGAQIGNAMSQNIIERLLIQLLPAAGLVSQDQRLRDRWLAASRSAIPADAAPQKKRAAPRADAAPQAKRARRV